MNQTIVLALGGNALGNTPYEQKELILKTASIIAGLVVEGYKVVLTHGNGPQVGMINNAFDAFAQTGKTDMPFPECGAMSQGYIGYHLQNAIQNALKQQGNNKGVVSLITQVLVDKNDAAFNNPTKPIGSFCTLEEAKILEAQKGFSMVEDSGRGYRRVVASPKPQAIVEINSIKCLVNNGFVVICSGGGGVPVIQTESGLEGVPAVIDKDFAAALLAKEIEADKLLILTAVDYVSINFGKPNQTEVKTMTKAQAEEYINQNQFAKGSMLPKVEAALQFVSNGGEAVIASLSKAQQALKGESGTKIIL
ncbi:MAG: carbamate kinase [Christensenellaceae bacterium]|nr:carbamate kinase [Christensenellaceae bacterium]